MIYGEIRMYEDIKLNVLFDLTWVTSVSGKLSV